VAPRPIGAAQSISDRWLLVLAAIGSPRSFFGGGANPARRHRFLQRVRLQAEVLGDLAQALALDQKALDLSHHAGGQHRGPARRPRRVKAFRAPFSIKLHRALDADRGDPESPDDVALPRMSMGAKLTRYHAKVGDVVLGMNKHRNLAVEVSDENEAISLVRDPPHLLLENRIVKERGDRVFRAPLVDLEPDRTVCRLPQYVGLEDDLLIEHEAAVVLPFS
jgi:hypothetical protein